jgi:citrate synthase
MKTLMELLMDAHTAAAMRDNASTTAFILAVKGSGSFTQALCAALMTTGDLHAPIAQARDILAAGTESGVKSTVRRGGKIPGYGSSLVKSKPDYAFEHVDTRLQAAHSDMYTRVWDVQRWVSEAKGVDLYPNAACYTAAVCELTDVPHGAEISLFVHGRMPAYVHLWSQL